MCWLWLYGLKAGNVRWLEEIEQNIFQPHPSVYSVKHAVPHHTSLAFQDFRPIKTVVAEPGCQTPVRRHGNCLGRPCSLFWKMEWVLSTQCFLARQLCQHFTVCCLAAADLSRPVCDQSKQTQHSSSWMTAVHPSHSLRLLPKSITRCSLRNHAPNPTR